MAGASIDINPHYALSNIVAAGCGMWVLIRFSVAAAQRRNLFVLIFLKLAWFGIGFPFAAIKCSPRPCIHLSIYTDIRYLFVPRTEPKRLAEPQGVSRPTILRRSSTTRIPHDAPFLPFVPSTLVPPSEEKQKAHN